MKPNYLVTLSIICLFTQCQMAEKPQSPEQSKPIDLPIIERLDVELDEVIPADASIETLASGFSWSEGPVWSAITKELLFSDVPQNKIYSWKEGDTTAKVWLEPSGFTGKKTTSVEPGSNGLAIDQNGVLVLCQHGDRRIARFTKKNGFTTIAATYDGKKFNSPNDLHIAKNGAIFFTDPPYGLGQRMEDPLKEFEFQGVFRVDPNGIVTLLIDSLTRPNGIALSPDESKLYVANSDPEKACWYVFDLDEQGMATNGKIFYDATPLVGKPNEQGLPDGMKIDGKGRIFATGPGGVWIFSPEGKVLGKIRTGQPTANCAFGENALYMTANDRLMRVKF